MKCPYCFRPIGHEHNHTCQLSGVVSYRQIRRVDRDIAFEIGRCLPKGLAQKLGVTNLETTFYPDCVYIEITLTRPGLLIGKRGEQLEKIKDHLTSILNKQTKIHIIEALENWADLMSPEAWDYL